MYSFHRLLIVLCVVTLCYGVPACRDETEFQCIDSGTCIKSHYVCDGHVDCSDHSDEDTCGFKLCKTPDWYMCKDNRTCLSRKFVCDTYENCPIGDDEHECDTIVEKNEGESCGKYEYTCSDKTCIPLDMVCDGKEDCNDKSDEVAGCIGIETKCKGFLCKNKRCLESSAWVCDGHNDCSDGSDEVNCVTDCKLENSKFLCNDNVTCIKLNQVCNGVKDCNDGSDESITCQNKANACNNLKCPEECYLLPTGPVCTCHKGFQYNSQSNSCVDINECEQYGVCTQGCVNEVGSYRCTCEKRFTLRSDNRTCTAQGEEPLLLYTTQRTVVGIYLRTRHVYYVAQNLTQAIGVTFDGKNVYWTNILHQSEHIVKAREDGSNQEILLTFGLEAPEDLAIDYFTGNIYFTDNVLKHIAVCSNQGYYCKAVVTRDVKMPRGIALDPQRGIMYWTDWGETPKIGKGSMDGSRHGYLVRENIHWPNGLSLDLPNKRLYWVDAKIGTIESIKLNGEDRRLVLQDVLKHPYGIAIFEDKIFWSDWGTRSVHSCNKFTGKNHEVVLRDRTIYDVHIYHSAGQIKSEHACLGHKCSHLCLLGSNSSFSCACPDGMVLAIDQATCHDKEKKETLLVGVGNHLLQIQHNIFGRHSISDGIALGVYIHKIAYNSINGTIYIADNVQRAIFEYNRETKITKELVSKDIGNITSLSFDHLASNLYWSDAIRHTIEVISLQNKERAIVHHYAGMDTPIGMAVIPDAGKMFIALRSNVETHIDLQPMHGRGLHTHFVEDDLGSEEIQFMVDPDSETVFWLDSEEDKIEFTSYEASFRHLLRAQLGHPVSMTIIKEYIVWSRKGSRKLYWTHRSNKGSIKKIEIQKQYYMSVPDIIPIIAAKPLQVVDHPCLHNNGGCSHVCVSMGTKSGACLCPSGLVFKDMTNTTCIDALDCEFRCGSGECVTLSRRCNGHNDCIDASDEKECDARKQDGADTVCSYREFACHDGLQCIPQDHRCDNEVDCHDKSDELDCEHFDHDTKCHKYQHACDNGRCIDLTRLCDGEDDCGDNSDETWICKQSEEHKKEFCGKDMFRCVNGQCVPKLWECDDHLDCADGSDEHDKCGSPNCPPGSFRCKLSHCIDSKLVCDGHNDCGDDSDEDDCDAKPKNVMCGDDEDNFGDQQKFQCPSAPTICLDISAKCNGTAECPRGEDEMGCSRCSINEFQCVSTKSCIRKEYRCDKEKDCPDGSDEHNCNHFNASTYHNFATACHDGMFDCKDGTCIDQLSVCDGVDDCRLGEDELDGCKTSCLNHPCDQKCNPSPYGAVCSCNQGYSLMNNKKTCQDINECLESSPCSQICENTYGSYRCTCYGGFMLQTDKISCKSIESEHYLLYSTFNQIRKLSRNPATLKIMLAVNDSEITGMDVNVRQSLLYYSVQDSSSIYVYNLQNSTTQYISDLGFPQQIAIDWVTNNVYFVEKSAQHSINVCHFGEKSACARLVKLRQRDIIKGIAVDAVNKYLFYSVMNYWNFGTPQTVIYKAGLDGMKPEVVVRKAVYVSAMECDFYKSILYYTDHHTKALHSVNYNGENSKAIIKSEHAIVNPSGLSIYENTAYIINIGSPDVVRCQLYGKRSCQSIALNVYNSKDIVVVGSTRQKRIENVCQSNKCSLICIQAKLGSKCLCQDGTFVQPEVQCPPGNINGVGVRDLNDKHVEEMQTQSTGSTLAICLTIMTLILISLAGYVYYRRRTGQGNFNINMHFQNPLVRGSRSDRGDHLQVKMCRPAMGCSFNNDFVLGSQSDSYRSFHGARPDLAGEECEFEQARDVNLDEDPRAFLVR